MAGFDETSYIELFTETTPVVLAFHGYPRVIHQLAIEALHHAPRLQSPAGGIISRFQRS